ncbi:GNAT family N-acetyltransferase [Sorangium cellulosum]|uniref:Acetyltransferase n=2 Tax=Sorangium cellulosum TaxID=56 RepID=A0A150TSC0_SORCE|nr:GNAT family N-acetyltransferase [Sorangium cellulosum]AGP32099.1 acetyltransferase [Sorangium cellulosum So0157-2]KYG07585.1 acetyltransferase [Sorangium cellulosum]
MISALTVRAAVRADMPEVARFAAQLVRLHHALDPHRFLCLEPLEPGYERWLTRELADPGAAIVVAERGGAEPALVGYAYGRREPRDWNSLLDAHGALHDVFVAEPARRLGAGALLLEAVIARLRALGAPRVVLHTATQNAAAQRLFERFGFRRTMIEMTLEL